MTIFKHIFGGTETYTNTKKRQSIFFPSAGSCWRKSDCVFLCSLVYTFHHHVSQGCFVEERSPKAEASPNHIPSWVFAPHESQHFSAFSTLPNTSSLSADGWCYRYMYGLRNRLFYVHLIHIRFGSRLPWIAFQIVCLSPLCSSRLLTAWFLLGYPISKLS